MEVKSGIRGSEVRGSPSDKGISLMSPMSTSLNLKVEVKVILKVTLKATFGSLVKLRSGDAVGVNGAGVKGVEPN